MTDEQQRKVEELRRWRLNQPCVTSEQALEQMEQVRRNAQVQSPSGSPSNETPSLTEPAKPDASSVPANA